MKIDFEIRVKEFQQKEAQFTNETRIFHQKETKYKRELLLFLLLLLLWLLLLTLSTFTVKSYIHSQDNKHHRTTSLASVLSNKKHLTDTKKMSKTKRR